MNVFRKLLIILKSWKVWINLVLAIVLFVVTAVFIFRYLLNYTNHGESITVPVLEGRIFEDAEEFVEDRNLRLTIIDSVYNPELEPHEIIKQVPASGSKVKANRAIYLTVRSIVPDQAPVPDVEGISLRNAISKLQNAGFVVGERIYKPYKFTNSVLHVSMGDKKIDPGTMYPKGTTLDLIVGNGLGDTKIEVPDLGGSTKAEAEIILFGGYNLNLGEISYDKSIETHRDSMEAVVYEQNPAPGSEMRIGEFVNVSLIKKSIFEALIDTVPIENNDPMEPFVEGDSVDN